MKNLLDLAKQVRDEIRLQNGVKSVKSVKSPHQQAADEALEQVCSTLSEVLADAPVGKFMPWLEAVHAPLARRIQALNDRLDWEWGQRVPMEQFRATLKTWTQAHREAAALYRKAHQA